MLLDNSMDFAMQTPQHATAYLSLQIEICIGFYQRAHHGQMVIHTRPDQRVVSVLEKTRNMNNKTDKT